MVTCCSAYNCVERFKPESKISFHRFPINNEQLLRIWCIAIRRKDFSPNKNSRICSKHFTDDSFIQGVKPRTLKPDAVPTIFKFPVKAMKPKRHSTRKSFKSDNKSSESSLVHNESSESSLVQNKISESSEEHSEEASENIFTASDNAGKADSPQISLDSLENENNVLRLTIQQLSRKIERFGCITNLLATKKLISEEAAIILKSAIEKPNSSNSSS